MPFEFSNFLLSKLHTSPKNPTGRGAAALCGGETLQESFMLLLTSAIYLKRDGCILISWIQTLLEITLVHGMSAIALRVYSISPNVWIASSR